MVQIQNYVDVKMQVCQLYSNQNQGDVYSEAFPFYSERPEFDPFSLFVDCGWDIRIDLDMQKGSPMSDFIEQLHVYFISDSYALTPHWGWGYTNKQLVWLCRQFRVSLCFITDWILRICEHRSSNQLRSMKTLRVNCKISSI